MKLLLVALCLTSLAGCAKKENSSVTIAKPSRAARAGCEWTPFEAKGLGLALQVEKCQSSPVSFSEEGGAVVMTDASGGKTRILEVMTKRAVQPVEAAIREQVQSRLADKERMGCVIGPSARVKIEGVMVLELAPGGAYVEEAKKIRNDAPSTLVCGEYGFQDAVTFFVAQPDTTKTRFAFVKAAGTAGGYDETTVRFAPDSVASEALKGVSVTSLAVAERMAASVEARMKDLDKRTGQFSTSDSSVTWTAFVEDGKPVMIVETLERGDGGSGSARYFYNDGKVYYVRETSLLPAEAMKQEQAPLLKALAFDASGAMVGGRKTVSGKSTELAKSDSESAISRGADLYKRTIAGRARAE